MFRHPGAFRIPLLASLTRPQPLGKPMPIDPIPGWRTCITCRATKEHSDFPLRNRKDGTTYRLTQCQRCYNAYHTAYYHARREKRLQPALAKLLHARRNRQTILLADDITKQFGGVTKFTELVWRVMQNPKTTPAGKLRVFQAISKLAILSAELKAEEPDPLHELSDEELEQTCQRHVKLMVATGAIKLPESIPEDPTGYPDWRI